MVAKTALGEVMSFLLDQEELRNAIAWYCFQLRHKLPFDYANDPWGPSVDEVENVWQIVQKLSKDDWVPMPLSGRFPHDERAIAIVYEWGEIVLLVPMTVQAHPDHGDIPVSRPWVKHHVATALQALLRVV